MGDSGETKLAFRTRCNETCFVEIRGTETLSASFDNHIPLASNLT